MKEAKIEGLKEYVANSIFTWISVFVDKLLHAHWMGETTKHRQVSSSVQRGTCDLVSFLHCLLLYHVSPYLFAVFPWLAKLTDGLANKLLSSREAGCVFFESVLFRLWPSYNLLPRIETNFVYLYYSRIFFFLLFQKLHKSDVIYFLSN